MTATPRCLSIKSLLYWYILYSTIYMELSTAKTNSDNILNLSITPGATATKKTEMNHLRVGARQFNSQVQVPFAGVWKQLPTWSRSRSPLPLGLAFFPFQRRRTLQVRACVCVCVRVHLPPKWNKDRRWAGRYPRSTLRAKKSASPSFVSFISLIFISLSSSFVFPFCSLYSLQVIVSSSVRLASLGPDVVSSLYLPLPLIISFFWSSSLIHSWASSSSSEIEPRGFKQDQLLLLESFAIYAPLAYRRQPNKHASVIYLCQITRQ